MKLDNLVAIRKNKKIYRDGNFAIKVFDETFSKIDVLNEALNQSRVENIGLNVPKIYEVTMIDGKWSIVSEYIEGKTLAQLIEENPDKLEEYLEKLVKVQMDIHAKRVPLLSKLKTLLKEHKLNKLLTRTVCRL